ncbi:MAG: PQQ-dependent sugar dehydrogenase [Planctomycetota bacterium]
MTGLSRWGAVILGTTCAASGAFAQSITTERVASGLNRPVHATHAPGDFDRLFIVEKRGVIKALDLNTGVVNSTLFLDIDNRVVNLSGNFDERGLLSVAFHPDFQNNGYLYVYYIDTVTGIDTIIDRYQVTSDPNNVDESTRQQVLRFDQPQTNHNGGWMDFGPDGYLYISSGDGGGGGDDDSGHTPGIGNGQDKNNLLGAMLRIDVDGDDFPGDASANYAIPASNPFVNAAGADEIWAYGLRNAWRPSFDSLTGDLYIADVGQGAFEEVNFQPAGSAGGENWGWRCYEGNATFNTVNCSDASAYDFPFYTYTRGGSPFRCSITGGIVYRGCAIPSLDGLYFFADYCSDQIWTVRYDGSGGFTEFTDRTAQLDPPGVFENITDIVSFAEDAYGEIYIVEQSGTTSGEIYKIISNDGPFTDCDENGVEDACELLDGTASDANMNGIIDACDASCPGDVDGNGATNTADITFAVSNLGAGAMGATGTPGDADGNGATTTADITFIVSNLGCDIN